MSSDKMRPLLDSTKKLSLHEKAQRSTVGFASSSAAITKQQFSEAEKIKNPGTPFSSSERQIRSSTSGEELDITPRTVCPFIFLIEMTDYSRSMKTRNPH